MERVYEDCGAHPRRRGAKKIVSYIRPDDPRACAYDWRYYYGFYLGGSRMALYPADAETAKKCLHRSPDCWRTAMRSMIKPTAGNMTGM